MKKLSNPLTLEKDIFTFHSKRELIHHLNEHKAKAKCSNQYEQRSKGAVSDFYFPLSNAM